MTPCTTTWEKLPQAAKENPAEVNVWRKYKQHFPLKFEIINEV